MNKRYYNTETKQCVVLPSGSDSDTIIVSTDERVQVAFQSIDKVKYDRSVDDNGYPILLEYALQEDGTRYSKYNAVADEDGIYQPDLEGIQDDLDSQALQESINEAQTLLNDTDFYVIRKFEEDIDIPLDIVQSRIDAKQLLRDNGITYTR